MGFLASLVREKGRPWLFVEFPPVAQRVEFDHEELVSNQTYVEIWLESMQIVNVRKLFTGFFPALTSEIAVTHSGEDSGHYFVITSPESLQNIRRTDAGRVLIESIRLAGPVPYRDGPIDINLGLFRLKGSDLAEPYIGLLREMAIAAGIAFAGPAAPFVAPLLTGLTGLMKAATKEGLEIGIARQFRKPRTGLFGVFGMKDSADIRSGLSLDQYKHVLLDGKPVEGSSYILFSVQRISNRYDWRDLPDVGKAYRTARQTLEPGGRPGDLSKLLAAFERTTRLSDDLITSDAEHIIREVRNQFTAVSQSRETTAAKVQQALPPRWEELPIDWYRPKDPLRLQHRP